MALIPTETNQDWPEQAPSTNIMWPTSHGQPPLHVYHNISIISIKTRLGHSMHQVHPSKVKPLTPVDITKETGQAKEYLQNSSNTTTHTGFDATIMPTSHLSNEGPHGKPRSINQPSHHITRHICNNDGSKCKQAGRKYISASAKLGS
jgi:hypothetical protein